MPLVSVIIPAYNAEKYIERCLLSCLVQTLTDIEILVVDDCSNDQTAQVVETIRDSRIRLIQHTENRGCSGSRNTGIAHATGDYIGFVDADDTIEPDFYAKLLNAFQADDVDIAMGSIRILADDVEMLAPKEGRSIREFSDKLRVLSNGSACDKLFRAALLQDRNLRFHEGCYWEDNLFMVQALFYANVLYTVPSAVYNYIKQPQSITQATDNAVKRQQDSLIIAQAAIDFMKKEKIPEADHRQVVDFLVDHIVHKPVTDGLQYYKDAITILGNNARLKRKRNRYLRRRIFRFYRFLSG